MALYDALGLMSERERLAMARWLAREPEVLAGMFAHSVARFSAYRNPSQEPFNAQERRRPRPSARRAIGVGGIVDGRDLAWMLAERAPASLEPPRSQQ